jgi:hypothetical protein
VRDSTTTPLFKSIPDLSIWAYLYFVLTAQCMNQRLNSPWELANLGKEGCKTANSIFGSRTSREWGAGKRIANTLRPGNFSDLNLDSLLYQSNFDNLQRLPYQLQRSSSIALRAYALLPTAFEICREARPRAETYSRFLIRPDDRLVASCCSEQSRRPCLNHRRDQGPRVLFKEC